MIRYLLTAHRGKMIAGGLVLAILAAFAALAVVLPSRHGTERAAAQQPLTVSGSDGTRTDGTGYNVLSTAERALLAAAPDIAPATDALLPPIPTADRAQPDLYARAFFAKLFIHPYAGVTRDQMLAWLQAQQSASRFITGGTATERNRLLIESASDPQWSNSGFAALPDEAGWVQAQAGQVHVGIDRLTCVVPPDWESAVEAGDITDPGITARLVSGDMTMTWTATGQSKTQKFSVALTLLLEGPPTARQYGVVVIADTNVVQGASS
jgi:hypothetical protein